MTWCNEPNKSHDKTRKPSKASEAPVLWRYCNTPDMTFPICIPTLAISGLKLFYFLGFGFLSPCVVVVVMHLISCHHVHCICIRVHLMHSSIFPVVRFAFRCSVLLRWSILPFFCVWELNISGLDRDLPSGLGLLPVNRLRKETRGVHRCMWECRIAKRSTGKMLGCMRWTRMRMQCTWWHDMRCMTTITTHGDKDPNPRE